MKTAFIVVATLIAAFIALGFYGIYVRSGETSKTDACPPAEASRIEQRSREEAVTRLCEIQTASLAASPEVFQALINQRGIDAAALRKELQSTDAVRAMVESCAREMLAKTWPVPYEKMLRESTRASHRRGLRRDRVGGCR
jgi:hypothetical protein